MYKLLKELVDTEGIYLEPSALAGMIGPTKLYNEGIDYLLKYNLVKKMSKSTHIVWGTGGSMVPEEVMNQYYQKGLEFMLEKEK